MDVQLRELKTFDEMLARWPLIQQLNSEYTYAQYEEALRAMCAQGNYFQLAAFVNDECVGLTGVWIGTQLWCGKFIELDNFIVDAKHRRSGIGARLVEWLEAKAQREGCRSIRLDSYVTLEQAHRFYFGQGFRIIGFHMIKNLV